MLKRNFRTIHKTSNSSFRSSLGVRTVAFAIVVSLFSACATQPEKKVAPKRVVKQSCDQAIKNSPNAPKVDPKAENNKADAKSKPGISMGNCLPRGVIEITENFPVKPELRGKFLEANALLDSKDYDGAINLLKGVVGQSDQFSAPYINLGIAYVRKGDLKNAEVYLQKALEINPNHPVAGNEMGLVYRKTGRFVEARKLYEEILALFPDYLPARKNLGVLCDIYIQDLNCALMNYQEYLLGKPDDEKVKIWVADVKTRM